MITIRIFFNYIFRNHRNVKQLASRIGFQTFGAQIHCMRPLDGTRGLVLSINFPSAVLNDFLIFEVFFGNCLERLRKAFYPSFSSSVVILQSRNTKDALSRKACSVGGNSTTDLTFHKVFLPEDKTGKWFLIGHCSLTVLSPTAMLKMPG
jgi:hypothetical protein